MIRKIEIQVVMISRMEMVKVIITKLFFPDFQLMPAFSLFTCFLLLINHIIILEKSTLVVVG